MPDHVLDHVVDHVLDHVLDVDWRWLFLVTQWWVSKQRIAWTRRLLDPSLMHPDRVSEPQVMDVVAVPQVHFFSRSYALSVGPASIDSDRITQSCIFEFPVDVGAMHSGMDGIHARALNYGMWAIHRLTTSAGRRSQTRSWRFQLMRNLMQRCNNSNSALCRMRLNSERPLSCG